MATVPVDRRILEVKADLGEGSAPRYRYGSGILLGERHVLTAAHVVSGADTITVRDPEKRELPASLAIAGEPDRLDLALLEVPQADDLPPIEVAGVNRNVTKGERIEAWAVGYPQFAEVRRDRSDRALRETKQVNGSIAPLSSRHEGLLSLEVTSTPSGAGGAEWTGMSGAAVFAGDRLIGVVTEHAASRGVSDITLTPLNRLLDPSTAPPDASNWFTRLGVDDPRRVIRLPSRGAEAAGLFEVPELPFRYRERTDDLARLCAEVLAGGGVIGITAVPGSEGFGKGGIGKRTLAIALALDHEVVARFSDGILWVTVGPEPDLRDLQLGLARWVNPSVTANMTDLGRGSEILRGEFAQLRCLVVLEDVRTASALKALAVTGAESVTLCTARDPAILSVVDGRPFGIGLPTIDEARSLITESARRASLVCDDDDLDRILAVTGRMPQAISVVAATIGKAGRSCSELADELEAAGEEFREETSMESFAATRVALARLPPEQAERYRRLAVFREGEWIPLDVLAAYWNLDIRSARELATALAEAELLDMARPRSGSTSSGRPSTDFADGAVRVHRAKRGYLLHLHEADDMVLAHEDVLRVYRGFRSGSGWATLPLERPYLWNHLLDHLLGVRDFAGIVEIARDLGFLASLAYLSGPHTVERLLAVAADEVEDPDRALGELRRVVERSGYLLAPDLTLAGVAATLRLLVPRSLEALGLGALDRLSAPVHVQLRWRMGRDSRALRRVIRPGSSVGAICFSPESRVVASGDDKGQVRIWGAGDARERDLLGRHDGSAGRASPVRAVAFAPDGRWLASVGWGQGHVWDVDAPAAGRARQADGVRMPMPGLPDGAVMRAVAFSRDGRRLACAGSDGLARVWTWDPEGLAAPRVLGDDADEMNALVLLDDEGRRIMTGGEDGAIRTWDLDAPEPAKPRRSRLGGGGVNLLAHSPGDGLLACATDDGSIWLWTADGGPESAARLRAGEVATALGFSPDGRLLAAGLANSGLLLWAHPSPGATPWRLVGHTNAINAVAFSRDGRRLVSADSDRSVRVWDTDVAMQAAAGEDRPDGFSALAIPPAGTQVAGGGFDGRLRLWNADGHPAPHDAPDHAGAVSALAFSPLPDGPLASGGEDGVLNVVPLGGGSAQRVEGASVRSVAFSADGRLVAAARGSGRIDVCPVGGGDRAALDGHRRAALAVAFSPGGRLASGGADGVLIVWDVAARAPIREWQAHRSVEALAFSPVDEGLLASGGGDGVVALWNVETGEARPGLLPHTSGVAVVAFSADGRRLMSAGTDGHLRLIELETGGILVEMAVGLYLAGAAWRGDRLALLADNSLTLASLAVDGP